jgi:2,3-bisphosphoglycerate-dependent phosphoglycerate mutase
MGKLILLRHAESLWNAKGVWSGITDIGLSEKGKSDCSVIAEALKNTGIRIDVAFYSQQSRTQETLTGVLKAMGLTDVQKVCEPRFNERNYGEYTGMDKWKVKELLGEEKFNQVRRGWDVPIPNGETLKEVCARVVAAYQDRIVPLLRDAKNVLLVGHGNGLRALMKHLDSMSEKEIEELEMLMNQTVIYEIDPDSGLKRSKEVIDNGVGITSRF